MMPAVNYEPAGVMARIKKLDIGSLFKKKKDKNKNKSHPVLLGRLFKQRHWLLTLQHRSRRDRSDSVGPALVLSKWSCPLQQGHECSL